MESILKRTLTENVSQFYTYAQSHHVLNYWLWVVLVVASLLLVAATTLAAFYRTNQRLAGALSVANGVVIALQAAFGFSDSAQFYRALASEAQVLLVDLQASQTDGELTKLRSDYRMLVEKLGRDLPVGSGMAAISGIAAKP